MKYYKQFLILILFVLFSLVVWYGFSEGLTYLFTFPVFAVGIFLTFYLSKEFEQDKRKDARYTKGDPAPDTLRYIEARRWIITLYCLFFFLLATFTWTYLNSNLLIAIKELSYIGVLGMLFVLYVLLAPTLFAWIEKKHLSKNLQPFLKGDWTRGYLFLLPITFGVYVAYPYEELRLFFLEKTFSFPLFFVVYTFAFVALYCIVYLYQSFHKEDDNRLTNAIKKSLSE